MWQGQRSGWARHDEVLSSEQRYGMVWSEAWRPGCCVVGIGRFGCVEVWPDEFSQCEARSGKVRGYPRHGMVRLEMTGYNMVFINNYN